MSLFALEAAVRMWAMGVKMYLNDKFCALDITLVMVDVASSVASSNMKASAGRTLRVLRFLKFLRFLKGLRCVRAFYRAYVIKKAPSRCMPGAFSEWLDSMDTNGDGFYDLEELLNSMKVANFSMSEGHVTTMFNEIYEANAVQRQMLDDTIATVLNDEKKTISTAELEKYIHMLRPQTHDERWMNIATCFFKSLRC